ncbi:MAG: glycosyltransferase, partial [Candidatus Marinimicrobia bacterium]|nr:glycosyltransferase [Candidatus Neomarinimicrobiota bacterium]
FRVIIIDQSETPFTDLVNYHSQRFDYSYHHIDQPGLPNARNVGVEKVRTDQVIFLDDDCIPEADLIQQFDQAFKDSPNDVALIGGRVIEKGSMIFREGSGLTGGFVTRYGKTLKNFDTDTPGACEWAAGGNFAVRTAVYREVGGFDVNFIGTAVMEDSDFGYSVGRMGYHVIYSPGPVMQHLRIPTGGLRQTNPARAMLYRSHNSVYFFRKYGLKRYLPLVKAYLLAVAIKDWLSGKHGLSAVYYGGIGFIKGLRTPLRSL